MKKMTPGCYWASQPIYDGAGRVVGYTGQPNLPESRPIAPVLTAMAVSLLNRERIKRNTIQKRRLLHQNKAA
jgi:hypothetical protein